MLRYAKRFLLKQIKLWRQDFASWCRFWKSYKYYKRIAPAGRKPIIKYLYPCLGDDIEETPIEPIYFYQNAWAFEKIVKQKPIFHVDVGSHHNFVALLSTVLRVIMVDIRPLSLPLETLEFKKGSILKLPFEDSMVPSVSSICVIEHIGLGRYGDAIDPYGTEKAISELKRIVRPGGYLYISVPIDDENRTYFNAHRAIEEAYLLSLFEPFKVVDRRYIYGRDLCYTRKFGFGVGCYQLICPL